MSRESILLPQRSPRVGLVALLAGAAGCGGPEFTRLATTFDVSIDNVALPRDFLASGPFDTPLGADAPRAIGPGEAFEVRFGAVPGQALSFAAMFEPSNDLFFAPDPAGIALFDEAGHPLTGAVTDQVRLWDAGTEANEEPGAGEFQPASQVVDGLGPADEDDAVRLVDDGHAYPPVEAVLSVHLVHEGEGEFTLSLENVSEPGTLLTSGGEALAVPVSPGVFVVHDAPEPLFAEGRPARSSGLERLAEDADPADLAAALGRRTGIASPLGAGVFVVHVGGHPLFVEGEPASAQGLEALAEDGRPQDLAEALAEDPDLEQVGLIGDPEGGPLAPGQTWRFTFEAHPGDRLSLASMLAWSNDLFFAPADTGIALFEGTDPVEGDLTDQLLLWDAGTEADQWPGAGPDQGALQKSLGSGSFDPNSRVRPAGDGYAWPAVDDAIRLRVRPLDP